MAVTHGTTYRNGMADYIVDLLDGGTIELRTSGDVEVATGTFGTPAFGAASSGIATANAVTQDSSATGGTVAKFAWITSGSADVVLGSVTATGGGGDMEITSVAVAASEVVTFSSITYESAA